MYDKINDMSVDELEQLLERIELSIANKEEEYGLDSRLALERAMNNLKDREVNILNERFIIGKTQMEIAEELGISQAQISRIEKNAINNLKKHIK